jgi:hypothetical protein
VSCRIAPAHRTPPIAFRNPPQSIVVALTETPRKISRAPTTHCAPTSYQQCTARHVHNWWVKIIFGAQVLKPHRQPDLWKKSFKKDHCHPLNTMLKHPASIKSASTTPGGRKRREITATWKVRPHLADG